ncbi:MAG: sigma-54-dependent Fis family transcriptional regulator [Desulfuromonadales bacterium]|nr:sigma-54-dependent Fis family transcriptional regulator [Desulfuromonadales bacterium]
MLDLSRHNPHIVLVDDEQSELDAYSFLLESMGVQKIKTIPDSRQALEELRQIPAPIVFLDLNMPYLSGQDVLRLIKKERPQVPVIILTANSEIETAVECLKLGAHDYLIKPISMSTFGSALRNALEIGSLRNEVMSLKGIPFGSRPSHAAFAKIVTQNSAMMEIFQYIEAIAESGQPTLVLGETGSGKELIAKAIHDVSGLPGEFVAVDVSGLDDTLFSDTLFGHARGAYTGADKARPGLLEKAQDGTIFLDEIGDLSEVSQVKLLRFLQEGVYYPLGADQPRKCRARVVAAANKDLQKLAGQSGGFRMDLYYRLSTHLIKIPHLRNRREDIPLLVKHLVADAARSMNRATPSVSAEAMHLLLRHPFYGNIRELKTYLFDAVARCGGSEIPQELIAERLGGNVPSAPTGPLEVNSLEKLFGQFPTLETLTNYAIEEALEITSRNQSQAARLLGLSKQALHKRLKNAIPK